MKQNCELDRMKQENAFACMPIDDATAILTAVAQIRLQCGV